MLLDLEDLAEKSSNQVPNFSERLTEVLPNLAVAPNGTSDHRGDFLNRVGEGITIEQVVERSALALQALAGMAVGFSRTRAIAIPGVYQVVMEYLDEQAGRYAVRAAVRLCQSIVSTGHYPQHELEQDLRDLKQLWAEAAWGPSTEVILQEAEAQKIPWLPLAARSIIQLGYGKYQRRIQATLSDRTGILAVELASDKESTKTMLQAAGVPVPRGTTIRYLDELDEAIEKVGGFPVVIKPLSGNHGRGITLNIDSWELAEVAYDAAKDVSREVIVEHYYSGRDHRVLVVDNKVVAVAERVPAHVIGDGKSTIEALIERTNQDPQRGEGHENVLTRIEIDRTTRQLLRRQGDSLDTVLPTGKVYYLQTTANLSTGGIAIDRTDEIHPENVWLVQRVVKIIGLDIAGLDIVTPDISRPLREVGGAVIEVNAAPGFRMHVCPSQGTSRNVAKPVLEMLFPPGTPSRIPIIAVTGIQGKTMVTRLIAYILRHQQSVGYTTADGTYINSYLVDSADSTGSQGAHLVLQDPTVEVAVLETDRSGIMRSGLGFSTCDVGVVLNVAAALHNAAEAVELARLESVVAESVMPDGYAVLNADDPVVAAMAERVSAQVAYFTMHPENKLVQTHTQRGGLAATYENGYLSILKGDSTLRIEQVINIPLVMSGQASLAQTLAASLAAFTQGTSIEDIRAALVKFRGSGKGSGEQMIQFDQDYPVQQKLPPLVTQQTYHPTLSTSAIQPPVLVEAIPSLHQPHVQSQSSEEATTEPLAHLQARITVIEEQLEKSPQQVLQPLVPDVKQVSQDPNLKQQIPEKEPDHHSLRHGLHIELGKPVGKGFLLAVGLTAAGILMFVSITHALMPKFSQPVQQEPTRLQ